MGFPSPLIPLIDDAETETFESLDVALTFASGARLGPDAAT